MEFSTFIGAVGPKVRTDQYKILSALYMLDAQRSAVTVTQIRALLNLHFGADIPSNINARLRSYPAFVLPTEKGPPLKWKLSTAGVEHLRKLSGLPLTPGTTDEDFDYDIGIICALEHPEFVAVVDALGGASRWNEIGSARYTHVYRTTTLRTDDSKDLKVIGTTASSMGLTAAAVVTTQLILQFRPRIVVMVGIAAGTRSGGKQFGDVLVADPSVDYNSGKVALANGIREFLPDPYPIGLNPRLRSILQRYKGDHPCFSEIRGRWRGNKPSEPNRLHVGPLGAADQVIDDAERMIEIQKNWRKLIGVEMETYGVYRACHEAPEPKPRFVSFKAVCDFAAEKSDSWQDYAAFMAAQFTFSFFRTAWSLLWHNPEINTK